MQDELAEIRPYLDHIEALPFVTGVAVLGHARADLEIRLATRKAEYPFLVELKKTNLTRELVDAVLAGADPLADPPWILFAPYVGRPLGQYLADHDANYLDKAGNCRIRIGDDHFALIHGQRLPKVGRGRGLGLAGYRVLFTVLARPQLINEPVRTLAETAGTSKNAAAEAIHRLAHRDILGGPPRKRVLLDRKALLDLWLAGYTATVRPRLLIGRFQTRDPDPAALEHRIENVFGQREDWAWGAGAAAMRLTPFYRGPKTVLHVTTWQEQDAARLQALRAEDGPLVVLRVPAQAAFDGQQPRTVHPLLVYAELLTDGEPRAREAADRIYRDFLQDDA